MTVRPKTWSGAYHLIRAPTTEAEPSCPRQFLKRSIENRKPSRTIARSSCSTADASIWVSTAPKVAGRRMTKSTLNGWSVVDARQYRPYQITIVELVARYWPHVFEYSR